MNQSFHSAAPHGQGGKGPTRRPPIQIPTMDTSRIFRKWLDLAYSNDSPSQRLDIYLPEQGDGPFPLIVAIHGGAFLFGDKADMQAMPMMSGLRYGYAVASINYRLSEEAKFPALIRDCKSAIRFLRMNATKFYLNPDRIAVWGGSAGGYLAAMLGTSPTIRELDEPAAADLGISCGVQAVVDWCGPTESFIKMDEEFRLSGHGSPDHSEEDSPESRLMGMKITEIPELVRIASPMTYITENIPPFLIQHGELDHIVPVEQSIEFAAAITRIAGPEKVTLEVLPGVDHHGDPGFETEENLQHVYTFLNRCLSPRQIENALKKRPAPGPNKIRQRLNPLQIKARWILRKLKHPWSDEKDKEINQAVDAFQQLKFNDPNAGITLKYNLYVPKDYDPNKSYPLVLFIHDAGVVSKDTRMTLIQGLGAVIWATPSEQAKHECFVLAPQYSNGMVNDKSEAKPHLDVTVNLVKAVISQYSIDNNRVYTTGQSMGCMASIEMLIRYPDLFAAALLVAGQWDPTKMSVLTKANMWIIVSEGDRKAFPGMNASMAALEAAGAKISRATWNGRASAEEFAIEVGKMIAEGNSIKYTVFANGTVVPENLPDDYRNNHIYTWQVAYTIEGLRDWLFSQVKR